MLNCRQLVKIKAFWKSLRWPSELIRSCIRVDWNGSRLHGEHQSSPAATTNIELLQHRNVIGPGIRLDSKNKAKTFVPEPRSESIRDVPSSSQSSLSESLKGQQTHEEPSQIEPPEMTQRRNIREGHRGEVCVWGEKATSTGEVGDNEGERIQLKMI